MKIERTRIESTSKTLVLFLLLLCLSAGCSSIAGVTAKSGTLLNIEIKTAEPNLEQITERAVGVMQNRLNSFGMDGEVRQTLPNRLEIKIYGDADSQRVKEILLAGSKLEFKKVITPPSPMPLQTFPTRESALQSLGGAIPANRMVLPYSDSQTGDSGQWIIVEKLSIVDGSQLRDASAYTATGEEGDYQIMFSLTPDGAQKFGDWTGKNISNYLAVILNDEVKSAPYIRSQIFDQGQIDGRFTRQKAEDLALILKSGYVPATFQLIDERKF